MPDFLERRPRYRELHHSFHIRRHDEEVGTTNRSPTQTLPRAHKKLRRQPRRWNKPDRIRIHAQSTQLGEPLRPPWRGRRRRRLGNSCRKQCTQLGWTRPALWQRTQRLLAEPQRIFDVSTLTEHHKRVKWTSSQCCCAVSSTASAYAIRLIHGSASAFFEDQEFASFSIPSGALW
jgi:hypothetical protein